MSATWQLNDYFPQFDGPEYREHVARLERELDTMEGQAKALGSIRADNTSLWAELLLLDERLMADFSHWAAYVGCLGAADAANEAYKAASARVAGMGARFTRAFTPVMDALRLVSDHDFELLVKHPELVTAKYRLGRLRQEAAWNLEPELEILAAELGVDGIQAWGRLYDEVSGKLTFPMPDPETGEERQVPMAQKRSLLEDPDPEVRGMVLERSNKAWESVEHVASAALNAIAGTRRTLYKRRGLESYLEKPFFDAACEPATVEAMWKAVEKRRPVAERAMAAKAALLGKPRLGFQDLSCPVPQAAGGRYDWEQAKTLVLESFSSVYPALGAFAGEMLAHGRVESEKRAGKRPGAFCMTSLLSRVSHVFMSFGGGLGDVQTLAHELGHAFHSRILSGRRAFAARYPMTLAETASTFGERLLQNAILARGDTTEAERLALLAARCDDAVTFMCDIRMRYIFECSFYEERASGEVGAGRLKELLLDAQKYCYGDGLDPEFLDPLFWASKLHFYITGVSFYNFPYTFGFLFSLGLAQLLQDEGEAFLPRYEKLLEATGSATCEEVVHDALGLDIREISFWDNALDLVEADVEQFGKLAAEYVKNQR